MARQDIYRALERLSNLLASIVAEMEEYLSRAAEAFAQGAKELAEQYFNKAVACEGAIKGIEISFDNLSKKIDLNRAVLA